MAEVINYENANGVMLSLSVVSKKGSRNFCISYKSRRGKISVWPKLSLLFGIIFNIISLFYIRISMTALLILVVVFVILLFFWITHSVQSETLLVIPSIGIQSSVKYVCGSENYFIPWNSIDDVIINEVIKLNRVLYFLTVLVKTKQETSSEIRLIPLFKYTKPRLFMIEKIYSEFQSLLLEHSQPEGAGDTG